jgi:hypothetical protein
LNEVSTTGGSVATLRTGVMANSIAVDSTNVYWSDQVGLHAYFGHVGRVFRRDAVGLFGIMSARI